MVTDNLLSLPPTSVTSFLLKVAVYEERLLVLDSVFVEEDRVNDLLQEEKALLEQMKILSEGIRRGEKKFSFEFFSGGSNRWFTIKAKYTDELAEVKYPIFELLVTDITYVKQLKKRELAQSAESRHLANQVPCGIVKIRLDEGYPIEWANEYFIEKIGSHCFLRDCIAVQDLNEFQYVLKSNMADNTYHKQIRVKCSSGGIHPFELKIEQCGEQSVYCILSEQKEKKEQDAASKLQQSAGKKELEQSQNYDELTGLYREQKFYNEVKKKLSSNENKNYAMIAFDVDSFCVYNDLYNETIANQLLCHIAEVLRKLEAEDKVYSRYCADQFSLLISYEEHANIIKVLNEIRLKCAIVPPLEGEVKLSFGICQIAERSTPIRLICDWARMAEETVKGLSMQYYAFFNGHYRDQILERKKIENEMTAALEQEQFVMYLQPKYNLETHSVIGAEALVRWKHPRRGMIPPDLFIPIFEKNGFIIKLDEYIWEEACKQISKWLDEGKEIPISVNISRLHTYDTDFVEKLMRLVRTYQIPVHLLQLEFTESMFVEDEQTLLSLMHRLKEQGFTLLMDDFGSGYSSLNMLKNVPIDIIKLDRAFFQDIMVNTRGKVIIESSIRMIHDLQLDVTAEGIEEKEHIEFLNSCNCNTGQGYFYAKPMEVGEFEHLCLA